jgi:protein O-GlcNAc transferase
LKPTADSDLNELLRRGLECLGRSDHAAALPLLEQAARAAPELAAAQLLLAQALQQARQHARAIRHFDRAQELGLSDPHLELQRYRSAVEAMSHNCDWRQYERIQRLARSSILAEGPWLVGEAGLKLPYFSNAVLLKAAQQFGRSVVRRLPPHTPFRHRAPEGRIRLGFIGADFFNQATSLLMTGFIEALDRSRFEALAYDHGAPVASSGFRARIERAYDRLVPITNLSDEDAAALIHGDRIDLLFSIKDPPNARLGVLARRPAPIQLHYLYYPGTSGLPFMDYIVADAVVIPPGAESAYTEKVLRLPGCYQPNDAQRPRAHDTSARDWGLPEGAQVLANFSHPSKFTPDLFDLWCALLRNDSRRLLWLLSDEPEVQARLRREAQGRNVAPERLYFAAPQPAQQHLNRLRHADLVLDTYPYGGHTLTSDALWAGTPVLTLCGETFASRVAASLLQDVGMNGLVACSELEYLEKAEALLQDPQQLRSWRGHLDRCRDTFALFDAAAYARKFETAATALLRERWGSTSV